MSIRRGDHPYVTYPHSNLDSEVNIPLVGAMEGVAEVGVASLDAEGTADPVVNVSHMSASWSQDKDRLVLRDISFEVTSAAPLLAVVGPVGAGKVIITSAI